MDTRQWALSLLLASIAILAVVSSEEASVDQSEESSDVEKRGGGRAFAGPFGAYYPSAKRISDSFYSFYDKRGGGRAYFPSYDKRGGGRAYAPLNEDKRGGGRAYFPMEKRGGGRAFVGDWAAYPRMERRGGGRAFAGDWASRY